MNQAFRPLAVVIASALTALSADAADLHAFVAKTSNASTLSFLNPANAKQISGKSLNFAAETGAVYSNDGTVAYLFPAPPNSTKLYAYNIATGNAVGSVTFPNNIGQVVTTPLSSNLFVSTYNQQQTEIYQVNTSTFTATKVYTGSRSGPMAVSPDGGTLYLVTNATQFVPGNTLLFLSTTTL
jgi:Tol biopolymer transport system component